MSIKLYQRGEDVQLTKNFSLSEFECKCKRCDNTKVDQDHVDKLQQLRDDLGSSISITSGYRCPEHNADVGGVKNSTHVAGFATDIQVKDLDPDEVADAAESLGFSGIGRYDSFTHLDSRADEGARWDNRTKEDLLPDGPTDDEIRDMLNGVEKDIL